MYGQRNLKNVEIDYPRSHQIKLCIYKITRLYKGFQSVKFRKKIKKKRSINQLAPTPNPTHYQQKEREKVLYIKHSILKNDKFIVYTSFYLFLIKNIKMDHSKSCIAILES